MVGGPSIVFTRNSVVDETFIRKSTKLCKSIVGIGASQLYPCSMCKPMPIGLYTRWNYDSESQKFLPRQSKTRYFENMILSYFQQIRPACKIDSKVTTGRQKKIDCFSVDGICNLCNTLWSNGLLFPLLSMSRRSPVIDWQRNYKKDKKEGTRPNAQRIYTTETIPIYWNVGVQLVGIIPNRCHSKNLSSNKFPLSATSQRRTAHARD